MHVLFLFLCYASHIKLYQQTLHDPKPLLWMRENFLVNLKNIREGRMSVPTYSPSPLLIIPQLVLAIRLLLPRINFPPHLQRFLILLHGPAHSRHPRKLQLLDSLSRRSVHPLLSSYTISFHSTAGVFASVTSLVWRTLRGGQPTDSSHGASGQSSSHPSFTPLTHHPKPRYTVSSPSLLAYNLELLSTFSLSYPVPLGLSSPVSLHTTVIPLSLARSVCLFLPPLLSSHSSTASTNRQHRSYQRPTCRCWLFLVSS
jgi:hypothetical protein